MCDLLVSVYINLITNFKIDIGIDTVFFLFEIFQTWRVNFNIKHLPDDKIFLD